MISLKPYLVTSNGERLVVQNVVRKGSLWSEVFFEKEVIFNEFVFETSDLEFEIKHLEAHNFVWQVCFFFHSYRATSTTNWAQIFTGSLFYACWDTPSEKAGLWQLPQVSSVFNPLYLSSTHEIL